MRKLLFASISLAVLLGLILSRRATSAWPLAITPTAFAFLPHVANETTPSPPLGPTSTPSPTPWRTLSPTPGPTTETPTPGPTTEPSDTILIVELSGHSDPEYVDVYNFGTTAQDMTGWYLVSVIGGETFDFPDGYSLGSADLVQIESGGTAINNPPLQLFWTSDTVWNNSGDKAILYNSVNEPVSSACYGIGCAQK